MMFTDGNYPCKPWVRFGPDVTSLHVGTCCSLSPVETSLDSTAHVCDSDSDNWMFCINDLNPNLTLVCLITDERS